jgi:hypothetical protein
MTQTDRLIKRILEVENFQNMACICDDFADFVTEILEWGVDCIGGVEFFDSYKSFRDFTFNPALDIDRLDAFIQSENGSIR